MARVTNFRHSAFPAPTWRVTFSQAEMTQLRRRYPRHGVPHRAFSLLVHRNSVMWPPGQRGRPPEGQAMDTLGREAKRIARAARRR